MRSRHRAGRAHGLAVAGLSAVRTPMEWGQVETLLISPDLPVDTADELIELEVVDAISTETVRQALKKTNSSRT